MTKEQHSLLFLRMQEVMATMSPEDYANAEVELRNQIENQSATQTKCEIMEMILSDSEYERVEDEARTMTGAEPDSEYDYDNRVVQITGELLVKLYDSGENK